MVLHGIGVAAGRCLDGRHVWLLVLRAAAAGDARDLLAAAVEDGFVLGVGSSGLFVVLAWEVLVNGVVECAAESFADALRRC